MGTLRDIVSDIRERHKLLSHDNNITDRYIASEVRDVSVLLIKRETNLRKLWSTDTLFTFIPCLDMIQVPLSECCDYTSDKVISRSKYQLPKISEGNYQYLIQGVYNIEASKSLKYLPVNRYINFLQLNSPVNEEYYWIQNRYLYATSEDIKTLRLSAHFEEDLTLEILYPDCECGSLQKFPPCINPLDLDFNLPGYLISNIKDMVSKTLLETYNRLQDDKTSNDAEQPT